MTGFSTKIVNIPIKNTNASATLTLKSLNSRFFEANCRLPYALTHLETECVKLFKQSLLRGSIYFTMHLDNPALLKTKVVAALPVVNGYLAAIEKIQQTTQIPGTVTINDVINLPHIFEAPEELLGEETTIALYDAIKELVQELLSTRIKEGALLANDLKNRIAIMHDAFKEIEPRSQLVIKEKKATLMASLHSFTEETASETKEHQLQFIQNQLDKMDIHEEIVRFGAHLHELESLIGASGAEKGKRIDFVLQELFREINTMSAKCADIVISKLAITIKVELEKAREQAQNIV